MTGLAPHSEKSPLSLSSGGLGRYMEDDGEGEGDGISMGKRRTGLCSSKPVLDLLRDLRQPLQLSAFFCPLHLSLNPEVLRLWGDLIEAFST